MTRNFMIDTLVSVFLVVFLPLSLLTYLWGFAIAVTAMLSYAALVGLILVWKNL